MTQEPCVIVVAGLGLVTPLGHAAWPNFAALLAGRTLAQRTRELPEELDAITLIRATGAFSAAVHSRRAMACDLAERACREALRDAGPLKSPVPLYLASSKAALPHDLPPDAVPTPTQARGLTAPHATLEAHLTRCFPLAPTLALSAACASGLVGLQRAVQTLSNHDKPERRGLGITDFPNNDVALVVAADAAASAAPSILHSYRRLGVLPPLTPQHYQQRPLHPQASGFTPADTAAAVLLRRIPAKKLAPGHIVVHHAITAHSDHHLIHPDPKAQTTQHLLRSCLASLFTQAIPPSSLHLHPHAPGNPAQDQSERQAITEALQSFPSCESSIYAVKGAIGHGLGAAPLAALVIAALMLRTGRRPPMPWLNDDTSQDPNSHTPTADADAAIILAAGFGGQHAAVCLSRHRPSNRR